LGSQPGTPYEGGIYEVDIIFPAEYPFKAPKVKFVTRIYHPNIKTDTGEICADVITNSWAPTVNLRAVLGTIKTLLEEPNTESPLEPEIAELFANDRAAYMVKAKAHTAEFATV
jgi:ubiquitin-conjugating enzyme E2 D/E